MRDSDSESIVVLFSFLSRFIDDGVLGSWSSAVKSSIWSPSRSVMC